MDIFDEDVCFLGEGPLWHPKQETLYWFDILSGRLHRKGSDVRTHWQFEDAVSAAGWVDDTTLLIASASGLLRFDSITGDRDKIVDLEVDKPQNRSNDGRADSHGGFWIGTMGRKAEVGAGAIYRYYRGELRRLHGQVSIPNSICFSPDGSSAFFADSPTGLIMTQCLDPNSGWPSGPAEVFLDLRADGLIPDGSVIDAENCLWNAQWGASRVARYRPDGSFDRAVSIPTTNASCPCFGGAAYSQLIVTTAQEGLDVAALAEQPLAGKVFVVEPGVNGLPEHRVNL